MEDYLYNIIISSNGFFIISNNLNNTVLSINGSILLLTMLDWYKL